MFIWWPVRQAGVLDKRHVHVCELGKRANLAGELLHAVDLVLIHGTARTVTLLLCVGFDWLYQNKVSIYV